MQIHSFPRYPRYSLLLVASLLLAGTSTWGDDKAKQDKPENSPFAMIKKLAGEWSGTATHGDSSVVETTVSYRVVSGGSAVMETLFCDSDHEMITMYHSDGDDVVLTHYCTVGNQPRMKAVKGDKVKKLEFRFKDGTNLDPAKDPHMHDASIEFVDPDHIRTEWVMYVGGKPSMTAKFDLKRKK